MDPGEILKIGDKLIVDEYKCLHAPIRERVPKDLLNLTHIVYKVTELHSSQQFQQFFMKNTTTGKFMVLNKYNIRYFRHATPKDIEVAKLKL